MSIYIKYPLYIVGFAIAAITVFITVQEFVGIYCTAKSSKEEK